MTQLSLRHRHYLRGKEVRETLEELKKFIPSFDATGVEERDIEVADLDMEGELFLVKGKPSFLKTAKGIFPTLLNREVLDSIPAITVDAGAVPHICNGSALMAPGIIRIEGRFPKEALVAVKEVTHGKTIAVVKVLTDSEELAATKKGRVAVSIHYVGDKLWNIYRNLA